MGVKTVTGATICGRKKHGAQIVPTGNMKGHYRVSVCDKPKQHSAQEHEDSQTGERWHG